MAKKDIVAGAPKSGTCVNCHTPLGPEAKCIGISVDDGGSGRDEWCPRCFCFHRAALEPERWSHVFAVHCSRCGCDTIGIGQLACGQCGSKSVVALPPPVAIQLTS